MTATNAIVTADAAHLVTDGAAVDSTGRLAHTMNKVWPMPHLNAAVAVRGTRNMASVVVDAISSGASSFDDLKLRAVEIIRATIDPIRPIWEANFGRFVMAADVVVAGWSEKGPSAFMLATDDHHGAQLAAWTPLEIAGTFFTPTNAQLATDFARLQLSTLGGLWPL